MRQYVCVCNNLRTAKYICMRFDILGLQKTSKQTKIKFSLHWNILHFILYEDLHAFMCAWRFTSLPYVHVKFLLKFVMLLLGYKKPTDYLEQWWANYGPQARCGPLRRSIRPTADFKIIVWKFSISVFWKNSSKGMFHFWICKLFHRNWNIFLHMQNVVVRI